MSLPKFNLNQHLELRQLENGNYHLYLYNMLILNGIEIESYERIGDSWGYIIYLVNGIRLSVHNSSTIHFKCLDNNIHYLYNMTSIDSNNLLPSKIELYKNYLITYFRGHFYILNIGTSTMQEYATEGNVNKIVNINYNIMCYNTPNKIIFFDLVKMEITKELEIQNHGGAFHTNCKDMYYVRYVSGQVVNNNMKYNIIGYDLSNNIIFHFYISLNDLNPIIHKNNREQSILFLKMSESEIIKEYVLDTKSLIFKELFIDNSDINNYKNDTYYNVKKEYKLKTNLYKIKNV